MNDADFDELINLADEILEYYYKNPEEEKAPSPKHVSHYTRFDENGNIVVKNLSAFFIPELKLSQEIKGVTYVVDGTYEGTFFLHNKIKRIIDHVITEDKDYE